MGEKTPDELKGAQFAFNETEKLDFTSDTLHNKTHYIDGKNTTFGKSQLAPEGSVAVASNPAPSDNAYNMLI